MYFTHLFENLPKLDLTNKEELRKYLPYSRDYQAIYEYYQRAK